MDTRLSDNQIIRFLRGKSCRKHRLLCYSLMVGLTLISHYLVGDDVVGTYSLDVVDRESGEISKSEGASTKLSISKEVDGTYAASITYEVSEEAWAEAQTQLKDFFDGLSPDAKKSIALYGGSISGAKPSEAVGMFTKAWDYVLNEKLTYEDVAHAVETASEVIVEGNTVSIFVPILADGETIPLNTDGKQVKGDTYEIKIENGELNGTITGSYGSDLFSQTTKIHGKLIDDSTSLAEDSNGEESNRSETTDSEE